MASIRTIGDGKTYMAEFIGPSGKRHAFSTKTKDKKRAAHVASVYESVGREWRGQEAARVYFEKKVRELMAAAGTDVAPQIGFGDWTEKWLSMQDVTEGTLRGYRALCAALVEGVGADTPLGQVSPMMCQGAIDRLASGSHKKSAANAAVVLRRLTRDATKLGLVSSSAADGAKAPRVSHAAKGLFTYDDLCKLRDACDIKRGRADTWRDMLTLLYHTGARPGDVLLANANDLQEGVWRFVPQKTRKHGTEVAVPLHAEALEVFERRGPGELFAYNASAASSGFPVLMDKAGIEYTTEDGRRSHSLHSFRHSMASRMHAAGVDERTRMAILGHTSEQTNRGYTQAGVEALREAMGKV